ncbi:hypothetical protein LV92_02283 [Arenibacter echinorum]|uniref:Uncharacterized protein n=1 Tax=Arenibacter echinorum TaxID=440515 RepID=A0A327R3F0_9FLAO|nr:hypothetical protein LV92_02283 [Arenibacter echinorum]
MLNQNLKYKLAKTKHVQLSIIEKKQPMSKGLPQSFPIHVTNPSYVRQTKQSKDSYGYCLINFWVHFNVRWSIG